MASPEGEAARKKLIDREPVFVAAVLAVLAAIALVVWCVSHKVETVFGVLGALGVVFAVIQFVDARRTIDSVKTVGVRLAGSTRKLEQQLSTRHVGVFPTFLPKIVELLADADESIVVFCDYPAYGEFSAPEAFADYLRVLKEKAGKVSLLCLDTTPRRKLAMEQMGDWDTWRSRNETRLRDYLSARDYRGPEPIPQETFLDLLASRDADLLTRGLDAATRWTTTLDMPLYFWIVDGEEAVFALATFGEDALEVGFKTSDGELIHALEGIFERYSSMDESTKFEAAAP
jgi:hypothetical protein